MTHIRSMGATIFGGTRRSATRIAVALHGFAKPVTFALVALCSAATTGRTAELSVSVLDRAGRGVSDVVVTVTPVEHGAAPASRAPATAVMDQRNRSFVPRVLVVAVGTSVQFPNNDTVSHQVYSFSPAKRFQLPLYKGMRHEPVTFDREGLVVLGCNIHDQMAGYVYVTSAPFFGLTGAGGTVVLTDLPAGDYRIALWSPLVADPPAALERTIHIAGQEPTASRIQLARDLRARPEPRPRRGDWEY